MDEGLSQVTVKILEKIGGKFRVHLNQRQRQRYFLSEGTGMELWWLLKSKDFSPEELETCKNELIDKDLLEIIERENLPPYYVRFQGQLAMMTRPIDREKYSRGQVRMSKKEDRTEIKLNEKILKRYREQELDEKMKKVVDSGLDLYSSDEKPIEETLEYLKEKGLDRRTLKYEIDEEEINEVIEELKKGDLAEVEEKVNERKVCHFFVSEWVQRDEKRARFFFSPEIYKEYLS